LAELPKVAIVGAGSVGCFIGGCWQAAGLPVTFIGRQKFAEDIRANGLTLSDYSGWQTRLNDVDYRTDMAVIAESDIIVLTVKSADTAATAREIGARSRKGAAIISFQNGVGNTDVLRNELGDWLEIIPGMIPYNVAYLGGGR